MFTRVEAVKHLAEVHGIKYSPKYFTHLASSGKGPAYYRVGHRSFYTKEDLAEWVKSKTSPRICKASEFSLREKTAA